MTTKRPTIGPLIFFTIAVVLGAYFAFAAVQGRYGILQRAQIEAEIDQKRAVRDNLRAQVDRMANLTHRLSDNYLDLDLLDQQARDILGEMRSDEIVIR
ncbi:septum formation initiator family protein [Thioclava sp. BHET1]|uniref:Septum formation initiator n=1 Tax=Thioclava dalianensis TaxID=1185766 RepID=A0A074UAD1_9RHOB|nr:septum formation initiator family protein [Thioclava dalianensis]KEP71657.1 septum formation initiator precursor [Thioclava dalianensis]TMV90129.1 septum formation initiator family protein [Thioclava sp. BHET1]SFN41875.1 Cell division protein FtsB [Thioclava dalianensis]